MKLPELSKENILLQEQKKNGIGGQRVPKYTCHETVKNQSNLIVSIWWENKVKVTWIFRFKHRVGALSNRLGNKICVPEPNYLRDVDDEEINYNSDKKQLNWFKKKIRRE